jgi:thiol-disulfide isomerase/thioredoxin
MRKILFLFAILANFSFAARPSEKLTLPPELNSGKELPWFALDAKDGENSYNAVINNSKLKEQAKRRGSKRVVISFFATWCIPCHEGLKLMSEKAGELENKDILVLLVNIGESEYPKVNNWLKKYAKEQWLIGFDKFSNLPESFGMPKVSGEIILPKTLILDANLQPLMLIGQEGYDFPQILWE